MNLDKKTNLKELRDDMRYLELLSRSFPTIASASTEIINLEAILNLPKGTEHYLADLHGEYLAFQHVLRNASGDLKRKVNELFGNNLRDCEKKELCTLIYYPEQKLELVKQKEKDMRDWYVTTLNHLVMVTQIVSSKYTRSKVRKALPKEYSYIIQELLHENSQTPNKEAYVNAVIASIIDTQRADDFIIAICYLIQRLVIDVLHILGDIFDRGPNPHKILDVLSEYHNFDIQWGNHDILWMGAAAGNDCNIANVLRIAMRYANMEVLEDGYGINLLPLATFAMDVYQDDPCKVFQPKLDPDVRVGERQVKIMAQMHKAISIIQFKLEGQMIKKRPEFEMNDRRQLHLIDFKKGTITLEGKEYKMLDMNFPTIDPKDPYKLTEEEQEIVDQLHKAFVSSEKLRKHIELIFSHGCMYSISNSNLLYHASIPLNEDGSLKEVEIEGKKFKGESLLHKTGQILRRAYFSEVNDADKEFALDYVWYLWCGKDSPAFDKSRMATFERYFLAEKETHEEVKGWYYMMRDNEKVVDSILDSFGVEGEQRHIINGHVPVKTKKGEKPIKAGGKLMVIDGGFSKAYHSKTGIAGYTLVYHSRGFELVQHEPFTNVRKAIVEAQDIKSTTQIVEMRAKRIRVKDTDKGKELMGQIKDLEKLLKAYRMGLIREKGPRRLI